MGEANVTRMDKTSAASLGFCWVVYVLTAVAGYKAYGDLVEPDLLKSLPNNEFISMLAKLAVTLSLLTSFPVQMHPIKDSVSNIAFNTNLGEISCCRFFLVTLGSFLVAFIIAMFVPGLDVMLAFSGAVSIAINFGLPPVFFLRSFDDDDFVFERYLAWVVVALAALLIPAVIGIETWLL